MLHQFHHLNHQHHQAMQHPYSTLLPTGANHHQQQQPAHNNPTSPQQQQALTLAAGARSASNQNVNGHPHQQHLQHNFHHQQHHPAGSQTMHFATKATTTTPVATHPLSHSPPATATTQTSSASNANSHQNLASQQLLQHQHQHHQHQHQHQQQHQQQHLQYNMNSDYSSSTYHIYDQISDLIIIKQQRMKRKRQQEHRRKVILLCLVAILLVATLMFLLLQSLYGQQAAATQSSNSFASTGSSQSQLITAPTTMTTNGQQQQQQQPGPFEAAGLPLAPWATPGGAQRYNNFDSSHYQPAPSQPPPLNPNGFPISKSNNLNGKQVMPSDTLSSIMSVCSGHGTIVISSDDGQSSVCKCDPGYWGDRCQEFAPTMQSNPLQQQQFKQQLTRCLQTNCNNNGRCNFQGRCQCNPGFIGLQCEFRIPSNLSPIAAIGVAGSLGDSNIKQLPPSNQADSSQVSIINQSAQDQQQKPAKSSSVNSEPSQDERDNCIIARNNCNGQGQCSSSGRCVCFGGFMGDSCQERDLCHGQQISCLNQGSCNPATGRCQCQPGFKGDTCELVARLSDTNLPLVGGQSDGRLLFNCSNQGKFDFVGQKCVCERGFTGYDCSELACDTKLDCGSNGEYDCQLSKCICQDGFSGDRCQVQQCSAQCLRNNGRCVDGVCLCPAGFYGKHCSLNGCPGFCSGRGQCVRTMDDQRLRQQQPLSAASVWQQPRNNLQPNQVAEWQCQCQPGSTGDDCGQLVERQCDDQVDNDGDGLVDCADSECCSDKVCQNSTLCTKSPDPLDILMRKQPPPPTSSFFQRMQFLIERYSSQLYSNPKDFNDSRASVVRGRVTYLKQGVTGVRVSVAGQTSLGITFTRDGGYFDLMVNGGGAVMMEFRREPFANMLKTVRVPWNEIVLMDTVELKFDDHQVPQAAPAGSTMLADQGAPSICSAHNYRLMRPLIVAAPKWSRRSHSLARQQQIQSGKALIPPTSSALGDNYQHHHNGNHHHYNHHQASPRAVILRDSAVVQQSITLPSSSNSNRDAMSSSSLLAQENRSVSLVYISSRANEFMSTISIQLTPPASPGGLDLAPEAFKLPDELKLIHLKIIIEGNLFEQTFEAQTNLSFTYAWNRRNVYRQKSFGLSTSTVSVGYEYFDCNQVIWATKHIQLPGHDLSISDIGNQWNLNIHHRFNYRDSILQRGDGQNFNLKTDKPRVVQYLMGDSHQRQTVCPYCDGATNPAEQRLLKPQAIVSAPDGGLYVGDHNLIRRIESGATSGLGTSERVVRTILELPTNKVPSKYSLALNLVDQRLYMADVDRHQIFLIKDNKLQQQQQQQASASTTVADLLSANSMNDTQASMNLGAIVDGESLLAVVGNGQRCQPNDRDNCGDGEQARQARLIEPKAMVFDLQGRMYIADGPNIRMVNSEQRIYTILGDYGASRHTKFPCKGEAIPLHEFVPNSPMDLAISPIDDTLHLLDDNVVYKITQDNRVQVVAGKLAHCQASSSRSSNSGAYRQQQQQQQQQQNAAASSKHQATEVFLQSAQSIAFNQIGELFISEDDQHQMISRILMVSPEDDTIVLYAGLQVDASQSAFKSSMVASSTVATTSSSGKLTPTVDSIHLEDSEQLQQADKQRSSNVLPLNQAIRASDYKFNSVAAMTVDQQGNVIVADNIQLRILSIEPDLPQVNAAGEFELQSPANSDELLVFNRHGHHVATRDLTGDRSPTARGANKYTFSYNVNTSFGQLASVSYSNGNKLSIYREGPQHNVKMIETAFGGQCKLDISRAGQVQSISNSGAGSSKISLAYQIDGGLLRQSRDSSSGEIYEFGYDEFGRANGISHSRSINDNGLPTNVECRYQPEAAIRGRGNRSWANMMNQSHQCTSMIVAE